MIASISTFRPLRGGSSGICSVCCVRHCTEALVYSNHPRAAAASSYMTIIFGQWRTLVPPINSGVNVALASVHALVSAVVALNNRQ